ncbi:MAG TPA: AI-2E family transporter [Chitinivibrionales bacterium]|nr:AI-2E family transporter [Chitinivibrionales bacterium]
MFNKIKPISYYIIQFGFYGFVLLIAAGILFSFSFIFISLFASAVFAFLLEPSVNYWETRGANRVAVILVIYVLIAAGLGLLGSYLVPPLMDEMKNFAANLPSYGSMVHEMATNLQKKVNTLFPGFAFPDYYPYLKGKLFVSLKAVMASVPALASGVASLASMTLLIPFITFFLLADGYLISKSIMTIVPNRYFEMSVLLLHKIVDALKLYVRGQLIDSCAILALTTVGYAIIGLPYFLVVGLVSGLANLIPYFGPIISFCSAVFVLLITPGMFNLLSLIAVTLVFVAVQVIDGTIVYPNVVGRTVHLHPLVVILGVAVGGNIGGLVGMLIAIPVISICKVTIEVLYTYLRSYSII